MSREVAIIYEKEDMTTALGMKDVLCDSYDVRTYQLDESHSIQEIYVSWGRGPDLVITVNLAGFSYRSSGDNSIYATLDVNTIHYIDRRIENEDRLLYGLLPVTMKFLTNSEDIAIRLKKTYRRMCDVSAVSDIVNDIKGIVDGLDWRREFES